VVICTLRGDCGSVRAASSTIRAYRHGLRAAEVEDQVRCARLKEPDLSLALQTGKRLDESATGFGLPITRELSGLYGGSLEFAHAPCGGPRVVI
jgi:hypothetical protein